MTIQNIIYNKSWIELEKQNHKEFQRAYEALQESEERFKLMFMNAPLPYQSLDENGYILDVNQAYLDVLGYTKEELIGKNFGDILHPDWVDHFKENFPRFKAVGEVLGVEFEMVKKDGSTILVSFNGKIQRDIKNDFQRTHCIFQDITQKKRAELEKAQSEARNQHIKKTESLGRMAGSIAHHYNNMLAVVIGNLELAMEYLQNQNKMNPTEEISEAINAARRAASMSGQILAYLGQKRTMFGNKNVDISEICRQCLPESQNTIPPNITLEATFPSYELLVNINPEQIKQVLNSIISNSVEAIGDDIGVILFTINSVSSSKIPTTHRFPIEWQPASEAFYACLEIRDNGCGIAQNEIEKIFDPFYSTRFIGRGLGLSVALGTIKAHDGCITVKSTHVRGTVFSLFLPLFSKPAPLLNSVASIKDESEKSKSITFDGHTVLVVEDEAMVRKLTLHILKNLGIKVVEAEDGLEAVEMFGQYKDEISCVISDLSMPRMDGWETIEALRRIKPDVKMILASGYDHSQVMEGYRSELPQAFLTKPYSITTLKSALTKVLLS
ncbi:MAG: PAS domain S-box protein [Desulfamplus sp.]|nr:PAS domain S-box protein [Desulfamplus sp.]